MATVDNGGQILTVDYKMPGKAQTINRWLKDIVQAGIYTVPQLTKISDTEVQIAPFTALIKDSNADVAVRLETTSNATSSIDPTTPYVIARLTWVNVESNYVDFIPVAQVDIQADDIVLGKGNFTGATLNSFDYSEVVYPSILKRDTDGVNQIQGDVEVQDNLTIKGNTTAEGTSNLQGNTAVGGTLDVTGLTTLSGGIGGGLDVEGTTNLDDVNVSGNLDVIGTGTFANLILSGSLTNEAVYDKSISGSYEASINNSDWIKHDSGLMIQWGSALDENINMTSIQDGFYYGSANFSFPESFLASSSPIVVATASVFGLINGVRRTIGASSSSFSVELWSSGTTSNPDVTCNYIAVGRWK